MAAFRAALEERTRDPRPDQLGDDAKQPRQRVDEMLGIRESGTARLQQAVDAFGAALEERTRHRVPLDWAGSFGNQGVALTHLAERGRMRLWAGYEFGQEPDRNRTGRATRRPPRGCRRHLRSAASSGRGTGAAAQLRLAGATGAHKRPAPPRRPPRFSLPGTSICDPIPPISTAAVIRRPQQDRRIRHPARQGTRQNPRRPRRHQGHRPHPRARRPLLHHDPLRPRRRRHQDRTPAGRRGPRLGPPFHEGDASYFIGVNRNKRAIALDLGKPEGKSVLLRLLEGADVLIENFKPGAMEKWGLGYEEILSKRFPA